LITTNSKIDRSSQTDSTKPQQTANESVAQISLIDNDDQNTQ